MRQTLQLAKNNLVIWTDFRPDFLFNSLSMLLISTNVAYCQCAKIRLGWPSRGKLKFLGIQANHIVDNATADIIALHCHRRGRVAAEHRRVLAPPFHALRALPPPQKQQPTHAPGSFPSLSATSQPCSTATGRGRPLDTAPFVEAAFG